MRALRRSSVRRGIADRCRHMHNSSRGVEYFLPIRFRLLTAWLLAAWLLARSSDFMRLQNVRASDNLWQLVAAVSCERLLL